MTIHAMESSVTLRKSVESSLEPRQKFSDMYILNKCETKGGMLPLEFKVERPCITFVCIQIRKFSTRMHQKLKLSINLVVTGCVETG